MDNKPGMHERRRIKEDAIRAQVKLDKLFARLSKCTKWYTAICCGRSDMYLAWVETPTIRKLIKAVGRALELRQR